jgi:hypothetical protein
MSAAVVSPCKCDPCPVCLGSSEACGLSKCPLRGEAACPQCSPVIDDVTLRLAIAFARLELLELESGKRPLTACPGVENVALAIAAAKAK